LTHIWRLIWKILALMMLVGMIFVI
jgi:hypothetical protein